MGYVQSETCGYGSGSHPGETWRENGAYYSMELGLLGSFLWWT